MEARSAQVQTQLSLIIRGFRICKSTYLLRFICNPKSIFAALSQSFVYTRRAARTSELPEVHIPS